MSSRRSRRDASSAFDAGQDYSLKEVDNLLFGDIQKADAERVITRPVNVQDIIIDEAIQVRVGGLDAETLENYVQILLNGGEFEDPIKVCRDEDGQLWLADGFHRTAATVQAIERADDPREIAQLRAEIHPGGYHAALTLAEDGNLTHGKALSNADKRAIYERRVLRGHEWAQWSDGRIAGVMGVSRRTVGNWRQELTAGGKFYPPDTRIGEDGKVYDTRAVQESNQTRERQADPPAPPTAAGKLDAPRNNLHTNLDSGIICTQMLTQEPTGNVSSGDDATQIDMLAEALARYSEQTVALALLLEGVSPGELSEQATGHAFDLMEYLNGYESSQGQWIEGLITLLEYLLGEVAE